MKIITPETLVLLLREFRFVFGLYSQGNGFGGRFALRTGAKRRGSPTSPEAFFFSDSRHFKEKAITPSWEGSLLPCLELLPLYPKA